MDLATEKDEKESRTPRTRISRISRDCSCPLRSPTPLGPGRLERRSEEGGWVQACRRVRGTGS